MRHNPEGENKNPGEKFILGMPEIPMKKKNAKMRKEARKPKKTLTNLRFWRIL